MSGDAMGDPTEETSAAPESSTSTEALQVQTEEDTAPVIEDDPKPSDNDQVPVCLDSQADGPSIPGHDSGVEVAGGEYASSGAPDPLSRASSLISCGSGCDDSFDILSCKNADRLDDYKNGVAGDGTSEGGSESSSVTGGNSARGSAPGTRRPSAGTKKRVAVAEPGRPVRPKPATAPRPTQGRAPNLATRERARSRDKAAAGEKPPPPGPKPIIVPRSRIRTTPDSLPLNVREPPSFKVKATKTSTARCRTPGTPPEEPRALRLPASGPTTPRGQPLDSTASLKTRAMQDTKAAFDKYATLPRRKRENSPELAQLRRETRSTSANRETSMTRSATLRRSVTRDRDSPPLRSLPPYPKHKLANRIRIYHETSMQTVLLGGDVECALAGIGITEVRTDLVPVERVDRGIQVDTRAADLERLEQRVRLLLEANSNLQAHSDMQAGNLERLESRLQEERADKMSAQQELQRNTERLLGLVGGGTGGGGDSLMLLESQLHTSANIVTRQQDEINKLHATCRDMQKELECRQRAQRTLETHLRDAEREATELHDFLQAEKGALAEALVDAEQGCARAEREHARARADCRATLRLAEQRRQEALALRARLGGLARPGARRAPALPGLATGLKALLSTLVAEHSISPEDLEDVIFHNEAFSRSASSEGCSPGSPPPAPPPAALPPTTAGASQACRLSDDENSADLLDSETEPCLMMENVLEDVQAADTYSQNLVSSGHSVASCPPNVIGHVSLRETAILQQTDHKFLNIFSKEDSCSSLQNLTTFSGDELSPVIPDEKYITEAYQGMDMAHLDYSENDSLNNLSQAILQRQRSEAECSMSEDYTGVRDGDDNPKSSNYIVDQVILVDNLVNKLLKVLKIIHSRDKERDAPLAQTYEEKTSEEQTVTDATKEMAHLCIKDTHHTNPDHEVVDVEKRLQFISEENPCEEKCRSGEPWCLRGCSGPTCTRDSPQPINSAA